jgi:hypothetical protein
MRTYNLTSRQKELLKAITGQLKAGTGKEPLIPVITNEGGFLIGIKGNFDRNLRGDLDALADEGLLLPRLNSKGQPIYSVRQSGYNAVENNFVLPDDDFNKIEINTGGGAIIGGNVTTSGGDFVGRDKNIMAGDNSIAIGGSVSGSNIIFGDGNTVKNVSSSDDLEKIIQQIQNSINNIQLDPDTIDEIKSDLDRVQEQMKKPEPNKEIIIKRLKSSLDYSNKITQAAPLVELIRKSVVIATQLFGGNKR